MRGGRKREREEGSNSIYTQRFQRETKVGRTKVDGWRDGGRDGWMDGGTGASLTDLLTRTQGGTSASLTQQHTCQSCRFFHKFSHLNSCGRRTQKATVKFRAEFPLKWLCKGYLSLKVALEFPWTEKLFSCGDCPVIIFKFTVHKIAFFFLLLLCFKKGWFEFWHIWSWCDNKCWEDKDDKLKIEMEIRVKLKHFSSTYNLNQKCPDSQSLYHHI